MCLSIKLTQQEYNKFKSLKYKELKAALFKKAKEDIITYKVVYKKSKGYFTPIYNYKLNIGNHVYQYGKKFGIRVAKYCHEVDIEEGLHSYTTLKKAKIRAWKSQTILKCKIPKGSLYLKDPRRDQIVSDNLIILEQVN